MEALIDLIAKINKIKYVLRSKENNKIVIVPLEANHRKRRTVRSIFNLVLEIDRDAIEKYEIDMGEYHE